jgi:putative flippase GtrA
LNYISQANKYQILRFCISGLIATFINFLVFNSFYLIFKNIIFASIFGYSTGLLSSFIFAKIWVFRDNSQKIIRSFFIFCFIYFLGGLEMSLIIIFLNRLIDNYKIAWLIGAFIGALNNYLGSKYFLFKK